MHTRFADADPRPETGGALARDVRCWRAAAAGIVAGVGALLAPGLAALVLLYVIAVWAVATGALEVVAAVRLREQIRNERLLVLNGALSVLFGMLILVVPAAGARAVVLLIGAYTLLSGVVLLTLSLRLRATSRAPARTLRRAA